MFTRRTRRSVKNEIEATKEDATKNLNSRKRQKSKFDSDEENSVDIPAEKSIEQYKDKQIKNKKSKVDTDAVNESDDDNIDQNNSNSSQSRKRRITKLDSDDDGSSSDSSVGDYLKTAEEIDLNSSFFTFDENEKQPDFASLEKKMFNGVQKLSDSEESDIDEEIEYTNLPNIEIKDTSSQNTETSSNHFSQLNSYNKTLEDAKACVQNYEKKKGKEHKKVTKLENNLDISHLLSVGETKTRDSIDSSQNDIDSDDAMDWVEIEENEEKSQEAVNIPKEGVQITVELPFAIRKKAKQVDFMASIKRRINRIKKENQVYVHKVHLLCWIAHGNFLNNTVLNNETLLGQALSLLPSEQCYPPKHADMNYLEQIVRWYRNVIKVQDTPVDNETPIKEQLNLQISKKKATCYRNFILLFIIILRSLGLQCRLVLSFQCLPLRPPNSELCSLSTKESKVKDKDVQNNKKEKTNTSKDSSSKNKSKSKPVTVNTSIKNKINKTLNSSIQNKLNQSLNNSKCNDAKTMKKSVIDKNTVSHKKELRSLNKKETVTSAKSKDKNKSKSSKSSNIKEKLEDNSSTKEEIKTDDSNSKLSVKTELIDIASEKPSSSKTKVKEKLSLKEKLNKNLRDSKSDIKKEIKEKFPIKIPQVDGADDHSPKSLRKIKSKSEKKSSLSSKLKKNLDDDSNTDFCISERHLRKARNKPVKYVDSESTAESDFQPNQGTSSPARSPAKDINHNKKSSEKIPLKRRTNMSDVKPSTSKMSNNKSKSDVRDDIINLLKGHMAEQKYSESSRKVRKSSKNNDSDYDSDFVPEPNIKRRSGSKLNSSDEFMSKIKVNTKVKRRVQPKSEIDRRVFSSEDENSQDSDKKKKIGLDIWVEVFLEEEEKWISVDLIKGQVHCISELYNRASHPVSYIVAWNNNLSLKDITARYCPNWNTVTRKLRVDSDWWNQTLKPFIGVKTARDKEEDEDLARQQLDKPLPTTISEYKNHPLYALKRHLLKFEAIYPPDALTLGFIRNEAVYARECVHTLHSREIWVKHAKVVKLGQQPYKIVKARPKYDKLTGNTITDLPLELFGSWQVEDYVPPTAENGIVPRNAFGNVELFKPCMLPKKTVHLQLPGLNKVARKLRIDCAPAVVGFDFHCGGSHPTFDGYVVCEEFKDTLIAAWEEDQAETAKKEQEKYEKRVYGNWRKLIKGLLIRERLKVKYGFGEPSSDSSKKKAKPSKPKKPKIEESENH